jgi:nitroreductase
MKPSPVRLSPAALGVLVEQAVLAPSSHNTQPWRFRIESGAIHLYADRTRALPVNDPEDRELTISCGCALMNLRVAAARERLATQVRLLPAGTGEDLLASLQFEPLPAGAEAPPEDALFPGIALRRTHRHDFESTPLAPQALTSMIAEAGKEVASLLFVRAEPAHSRLAELVAEGDALQWNDPSWRRELAMWLHPSRSGDGLVVPGLLARPAQAIVRTINLGSGIAAHDRRAVHGSSLLAVLHTTGDTLRDWLAAGQALQRVLLAGAILGIQVGYVNQPCQLPSLRERLRALLDITAWPQVMLRVGLPSRGELPPRTPRRRLEDVLLGPSDPAG